MNGINVASLVAGIAAVGSAISLASGHPALGALISDPATSQALTAVVGGVAALYSAFAPAILHSTTIAAAIKATNR